MYDIPAIEKITGIKYKISPETVIDTHILSRLSYPDREEHSLEYFGNLFKFPKGDHNDFTQYSQEMLDYCARDVELTKRVYYYLQDEMSGWDWSEATKLEYAIWNIQREQEERGVMFDSTKAEKLYRELTSEINNLTDELQHTIPLRPVPKGELKKIFLKNGEYTTPVKEWYNE